MVGVISRALLFTFFLLLLCSAFVVMAAPIGDDIIDTLPVPGFLNEINNTADLAFIQDLGPLIDCPIPSNNYVQRETPSP
jgi:hypothetical protein